MRPIHTVPLLFAALSSLASLACQSGGVGDPCIREEEYTRDYEGSSVTDVDVESKSFQCETRVCLSAYFQGRVSCPYGNDSNKASGSDACYVPGYTPGSGNDSVNKIQVAVQPQLVDRRPDKAVYCSCRCDGEDKSARYCQCPDGYTCQKLIADVGVTGGQLAGSYCVKKSAVVVDPATLQGGGTCDSTGKNCGDDLHPTY